MSQTPIPAPLPEAQPKLPSRIAAAIELHGASVAQQAAPYLFGVALVVWTLLVPKHLKMPTNFLESVSQLWIILKSYSSWFVAGSAILGIWATIIHNRTITQQKQENIRLKGDNEKLQALQATMRTQREEAEQYAEFLRGSLSEAQSKNAMGFLRFHCGKIPNFSDHARVSLYAHVDAQINQFILVGRFSEHPEYRKPNRQRFPADQGCIGRAWLQGGDFTLQLEANPSEAPEVYVREVSEKCGISEPEAIAVRMKSRFYYARAISHDRIRVGVVVYESILQDKLNADDLRQHAQTDEPYLRDIIQQACLVNPFIMMEAEK